jgi:Domain of unknown function (DUF4331)
MSSHREAPKIAMDPVADSTDLYAFVSPDKPDTVTIIANYIPLQGPAGGPNFYNFGDDVLYEIHISNGGSATPDITYQFQFTTNIQNPNTFLYNTGPIKSLDDANWNLRQNYAVLKVTGGGSPAVLGSGLASPPCNVGVRSTPNYSALAQAAIHSLPSGETVFAGQRNDAFFVDLGAIFDLGDIRPLQHLHLIPMPDAPGVNATRGLNVHSIAIQIPKRMLTKDGSNPTDATSPNSVIGVWTTASRQKAVVRNDGSNGSDTESGPWVQVSRLGNPLINEVVVPMSMKDFWNTTQPSQDSQFAAAGLRPELAKLLPVLYPGVFPNLDALNNNPDKSADRSDLAAILFTGIPTGVVPGFQNNTGSTIADMLRLNMAVPPSSNPNPIGLIAGDAAGFPNGRRVQDDVVTIELRAVAGATYPLVNPSYKPDDAVMLVTGGVSAADNPVSPQSTFPYLADPLGGFQMIPANTAA